MTVSTWKVYIAHWQVHPHTRRVHVCAVPVFHKICCHTHLVLCARCVCLAKNMITTRPQFSRLWYVSPYGLALVLLCCREAAFSNYQIVYGLPPPSFSHPDSLERWYLRHETALNVSAWGDQVEDLGMLFSG